MAAFTQPEIVEKVKAAALLSPISYLDHVSAPLVLRMVKMHIDQVFLAAFYYFSQLKSIFNMKMISGFYSDDCYNGCS